MALDEFHILLIDDDEDDFVNIKDLLSEIQSSKYKITYKASYKEGLEAIRQNRFDACLLDYRLGEHTGIDLLHEVQGLQLVCPIIFLTGFGDFNLDLKVMQIGAAEFLVKGELTSSLLERSIRYAMKNAFDLAEIRRQKENFEALFNSTFEGIIVHCQGSVHAVNKAVGEILGYDSKEMYERLLTDFIKVNDRALLEDKLFFKSPIKLEVIAIKKDGTEVYIELSNRVFSQRGQTFELVVIRDLTERKQMEAQILQQDRLASLGFLASSLAHEIGTPLGIIRSRAELAEKKLVENPSLKQDMSVVILQIDKIAKLVHSLLHLARSKVSDFAAPVQLTQVIDDVLSFVRPELQHRQIALQLEIAEDFLVKAEPGPLGQVLLNLLVNSIHAIGESKFFDHLILLKVFAQDKTIEIVICDTGSGIEEKNMSQLFKPFFTTKELGHGTGLGLATSYKLVQSWGGKITAENNKERGATFKIRLNRFSS